MGKRWIFTYPSLLLHPFIQGASDLIKAWISTTAIQHHLSSPTFSLLRPSFCLQLFKVIGSSPSSLHGQLRSMTPGWLYEGRVKWSSRICSKTKRFSLHMNWQKNFFFYHNKICQKKWQSKSFSFMLNMNKHMRIRIHISCNRMERLCTDVGLEGLLHCWQ